MDREEAIIRLRTHQTGLQQLGEGRLYLFGSTARAEARPDSDVDLLFDNPEGSRGPFQLMDLKEAAARILRCRTDIMTRRSLHRPLKDRIGAAAVQVL